MKKTKVQSRSESTELVVKPESKQKQQAVPANLRSIHDFDTVRSLSLNTSTAELRPLEPLSDLEHEVGGRASEAADSQCLQQLRDQAADEQPWWKLQQPKPPGTAVPSEPAVQAQRLSDRAEPPTQGRE